MRNDLGILLGTSPLINIMRRNVGVVGNTVFTGSTIDIKQGGVFIGSDSDSFNGTAIFYGTDSDDVWTNFGTTNQVGKTYLREIDLIYCFFVASLAYTKIQCTGAF